MVAFHCLPICGLPREHKRSGEDSVRSVPREGVDGFLKPLQGDAAVFVGHIPDSRAASQVCEMHGRERQQSMQDIGVGRADPDDSGKGLLVFYCATSRFPSVSRWDLPGPEREVIGVELLHLLADGSDVVDQSQILDRQELRRRRGVDTQAGEREHASAAPLVDGCLDFRRPHEVRLVGRASPVLGNGNIIVRAPDLVLGAVPASSEVSLYGTGTRA